MLRHVGVKRHRIQIFGHIQRPQQTMLRFEVEVLTQRAKLHIQVQQSDPKFQFGRHNVGDIDGQE